MGTGGLASTRTFFFAIVSHDHASVFEESA
jgi:hypothetical protein